MVCPSQSEIRCAICNNPVDLETAETNDVLPLPVFLVPIVSSNSSLLE